MANFSSHLISEALKSKHVLTLHRFNELFKDQVTVDVRAALVKRWRAGIKALGLVVPEQAAKEERIRSEKAVIEITLSDRPLKLAASTELGRMAEVAPSVKVPYLHSKEERNLVRKRLFDEAEAAFKSVIKTWREAFQHEKANGQLGTDFKIRRDERSVRLLLSSKDGDVEHETPIFYVSIEHGKLGSKLRSYDLIYLGVTS